MLVAYRICARRGRRPLVHLLDFRIFFRIFYFFKNLPAFPPRAVSAPPGSVREVGFEKVGIGRRGPKGRKVRKCDGKGVNPQKSPMGAILKASRKCTKNTNCANF